MYLWCDILNAICISLKFVKTIFQNFTKNVCFHDFSHFSFSVRNYVFLVSVLFLRSFNQIPFTKYVFNAVTSIFTQKMFINCCRVQFCTTAYPTHLNDTGVHDPLTLKWMHSYCLNRTRLNTYKRIASKI